MDVSAPSSRERMKQSPVAGGCGAAMDELGCLGAQQRREAGNLTDRFGGERSDDGASASSDRLGGQATVRHGKVLRRSLLQRAE